MSDRPVVERVRHLVEPIASDLDLDLYDVEQRGGTMRVTLDTRPGSEAGVDLDQLALATRLISRELDHDDPVPGRYTLEVTSPGVERTLRTPAHFQREVGKTVNVRLSDVAADERRVQGTLVGADATTATIRDDESGEERVVDLDAIDRARTVFVWGPTPKPGGPKSKGKGKSGKSGKSGQQRSKPSQQESAPDPGTPPNKETS